MAREKYTEVARTVAVRTGPRLRSAFPTIVVLEASIVLTERTLYSESNLFSVLLHYTSLYCTLNQEMYII